MVLCESGTSLYLATFALLPPPETSALVCFLILFWTNFNFVKTTHTHTHTKYENGDESRKAEVCRHPAGLWGCVKSKTFIHHLFYSISSSSVLRIPLFPLPYTLSYPPTVRHTHTQPTLLHTSHVLFSSLWEGCICLWRVLPKSCCKPISSSVFKGW